MTDQADFAVYRTNHDASYVMAYICTVCHKPAIAYSDDCRGLFTGVCGNGHAASTFAS